MTNINLFLTLILAAAIALIAAGTYLYFTLANRKTVDGHYQLFKKLLGEIYQTSKIANDLGKRYEGIQDDRVLANFETNLRMLEKIMESAKEIRPNPAERYTIRSLMMLNKECQKRLKLSGKSFTNIEKGKKALHAADKLKAQFPSGCFFCSRPFDIVTFKIVKVKLESKVHRPYACRQCRTQLENKKKLKVLHFMNEGEPVHWSDMPGYKPEEHFFALNKSFPVHKKPVLALVYSQKDGNNKSPTV